MSHYSYLFHNLVASYYEHKSSHLGISPFHGCNHLAYMAFHNDGRDLMLTTLKVCRAVVYMLQMSIIKDSRYHAVLPVPGLGYSVVPDESSVILIVMFI